MRNGLELSISGQWNLLCVSVSVFVTTSFLFCRFCFVFILTKKTRILSSTHAVSVEICG